MSIFLSSNCRVSSNINIEDKRLRRLKNATEKTSTFEFFNPKSKGAQQWKLQGQHFVGKEHCLSKSSFDLFA